MLVVRSRSPAAIYPRNSMVYWLSLDVVVEQRTWKRARRKRDGIIEDGIGRKGNKEGKKEEVGVTIDCGVGLFMGVPMRTICSKELVVLNVYTLPSPPASQSNKRAVATVLPPLPRFIFLVRNMCINIFSLSFDSILGTNRGDARANNNIIVRRGLRCTD